MIITENNWLEEQTIQILIILYDQWDNNKIEIKLNN